MKPSTFIINGKSADESTENSKATNSKELVPMSTTAITTTTTHCCGKATTFPKYTSKSNGDLYSCSKSGESTGKNVSCKRLQSVSGDNLLGLLANEKRKPCQNVGMVRHRNSLVYSNNRSSRSSSRSSSTSSSNATSRRSCTCYEDEVLSMSDDGCIYTYKGDQVADLPSSFFSLELPAVMNGVAIEDNRIENSSPEMDFLEMDFEPDQASGAADDSSECEPPVASPKEQQLQPEPEPVPSTSGLQRNVILQYSSDSSSDSESSSSKKSPKTPSPITQQAPQPIVKMPWSCSYSQRTKSKGTTTPTRTKYRRNPKVRPHKLPLLNSGSGDYKRIMIWSEEEALQYENNMNSADSSGAYALMSVFRALRLPLDTPLDLTQRTWQMRRRRNSHQYNVAIPTLTDFLRWSGSVAIETHRDLIYDLYKMSTGRVYARFFAMWPERVVNLNQWLAYWIDAGAVPLATCYSGRNTDCAACNTTTEHTPEDGSISPTNAATDITTDCCNCNCWYHQMIFGVDFGGGVYLTNPLERVEATQLFPLLCAESVQWVRYEDVVSHWNPRHDMQQLRRHLVADVRWADFNVIGQVARIIRESLRPNATVGRHPRQPLRLPTDCKAGITLAALFDSTACMLLQESPELPLVGSNGANSTTTSSGDAVDVASTTTSTPSS